MRSGGTPAFEGKGSREIRGGKKGGGKREKKKKKVERVFFQFHATLF